MEIAQMLPSNWNSVKEIYLQGIATTNATFQTEAPSWEEWDKNHLATLRYVILVDKMVAGWAALAPVSTRSVYAGVCEVSVYIHENYRGKGIGALLLQKLIRESEKQSIWTLQSGIFLENKASIELHNKHGFRKVGYREKIGKMNGKWRSTLLMERRSKVVGQD
jgi:L-amino acid N-acyltransferase YncA